MMKKTLVIKKGKTEIRFGTNSVRGEALSRAKKIKLSLSPQISVTEERNLATVKMKKTLVIKRGKTEIRFGTNSVRGEALNQEKKKKLSSSRQILASETKNLGTVMM